MSLLKTITSTKTLFLYGAVVFIFLCSLSVAHAGTGATVIRGQQPLTVGWWISGGYAGSPTCAPTTNSAPPSVNNAWMTNAGGALGGSVSLPKPTVVGTFFFACSHVSGAGDTAWLTVSDCSTAGLAWNPVSEVCEVPPNLPPVSNAGSNVGITLPTTVASPSGASASDPEGLPITLLWTNTVRPGGAPVPIIANSTTLTPTFSNLTVAGTYTFRLAVTDSVPQTITSLMNVVVSLPAPASITGSCPAPGTTATMTWSAVAGATYYALRLNNGVDPWDGSCTGLDYCSNEVGTSRAYPSVPGASYGTWVHACNGAGCSGLVSNVFSCFVPPSLTSAAASNCTIALNQSTCNSTVSWDIANPGSPSIKQAGVQFSTLASHVGMARAIGNGTTTFGFQDPNGTSRGTRAANASCVAGTSWDGTKCASSGPPPPSTNLASDVPTINTGILKQNTTVTFRSLVTNTTLVTTGATFSDSFRYRWGVAGVFNLINTIPEAVLGGGGTRIDTSSSFLLTNVGTLQIQYCVDSNSEIAETNETPADNCDTATFTVVNGDIDATPPDVSSGGTSMLDWSSSGASSCTVSSVEVANLDSWTALSNPGILTSALNADTTYELNCNGVVVDVVTVGILSPPELTATPSVVITDGGTTELEWDLNGQTGCVLTGGGLNLNQAYLEVNTSEPEAISVTTTYTLSCLTGSDSITVEFLGWSGET